MDLHLLLNVDLISKELNFKFIHQVVDVLVLMIVTVRNLLCWLIQAMLHQHNTSNADSPNNDGFFINITGSFRI